MKTKNIKYKILNSKNTSQISNILFLICIFAIYYLIFAIDKAEAKALSLGIYPPIIQIQLDPPATIDTPIAIHNYGDETVTLAISLKPFTAVASDATAGKEEDGDVLYISGKNPLIFQNIKISEDDETIEKVVIPPKQSKTLKLHLDIPKDEPLSDYYFSVLFISKNKFEERLNQLKIQGGIATNVLLSIKVNPPLIGAKPTSIGKIVEFSSPQFLEKGPVPFTIRLKNQSNHFITPHGTILIKNIFGKTIGELNLLPVNILADTTRFQKTIWTETFLFGHYTATLTITLSDKGPILVETIRFLVLPMQAFIGLAIIVLIILGVKKRLKTYREHRR